MISPFRPASPKATTKAEPQPSTPKPGTQRAASSTTTALSKKAIRVKTMIPRFAATSSTRGRRTALSSPRRITAATAACQPVSDTPGSSQARKSSETASTTRMTRARASTSPTLLILPIRSGSSRRERAPPASQLLLMDAQTPRRPEAMVLTEAQEDGGRRATGG